jgi:DNA-binding CsgD family transcriptional regulator
MTGFKSKKEMAMSRMSDLSYDIEQLYIEGWSARSIADQLECPIETVLGQLEEMNVADSPQEEPYSPYYGA